MAALIGGGALALTIHGPAGAVDLVVPVDARFADVAAEYAAQTGLAAPPRLTTRIGEELPVEESLVEHHLASGSVLVAAVPDAPHPPARSRHERVTGPLAAPSSGASALTAVAAGLAVLAGWGGAHAGDLARTVVVVLLLAAAASALIATGRYAVPRAAAAPAFGAGATLALVWSPELERLPTVVGVAALVAAVVAAAARAVSPRAEEALRIWIIAGVGVFVVSCGAALLGAGPQVVWGILLVLSVFGARLIPGSVVDVPDQYLIDLERLAVSAWSARERPRGRRGRTIVPVLTVKDVAGRGARLLAAAGWATLLVVAIAGPLLLVTVDASVDRIGARVMTIAAGAALLLSARSYRYPLPRALLRVGGLICLGSGLWVVLGTLSSAMVSVVCVFAVLIGMILVAAAVATGRGWRSVWWSARAELAEALAGATTLASLIVASGLFRIIWESRFGV